MEVDQGIVWIEDLNRPGSKSVTNDAENVAREINESFPDHRIFYKDSLGVWDEILHKSGVFEGFKPLEKTERGSLYET